MSAVGMVKEIARKSLNVLRADGVRGLVRVSVEKGPQTLGLKPRVTVARDILFIDGCTLPHPSRYRVAHQMEQLEAYGMTVERVFYQDLSLSMLRFYRGFVFFRCPVTETVREFIKLAHYFHKTCFFDIDDLVIDRAYTDTIPFVAQMSPEDKAVYDDGVNRMRETMTLCDYGITTTPVLQEVLQGSLPEVYVNRNTASDEMVKWAELARRNYMPDPTRVVIGYFSGSITHDADFDLVMDALIRIMGDRPEVDLLLAGELTVPEALAPFGQRVKVRPFVDWRKMPETMVECDLILAPLADTIFNRAKSENKWVEAALVGVPLVASDVGAFHDSIENGTTGVLVDDNGWYEALDGLINDTARRQSIGLKAHDDVIDHHLTLPSGRGIAEFIQGKLARHLGFVLPSMDISGGVNVVLKHADILREHGMDVTLIDAVSRQQVKKARRLSGRKYCVVRTSETAITSQFDVLTATLWSTLEFVLGYPRAHQKAYFVQNMERDFYEYGSVERIAANATYVHSDVRYLTMSPWCQQWLADDFSQKARYAPNGLDLAVYPVKERDLTGRKVKILIEGDSKDRYKNVDEAFRIVERLDLSRYEVGYLSYRSGPKPWYHVDHFYNRITPEKVGGVYAAYDVLLKTSRLESFSYPPLEMMATGGFVVVAHNGGNAEYVQDGENCLAYDVGDTETAVRQIERIASDQELRQILRDNGVSTAQSYSWENQESAVVALYA